jgi:CDP-diacylglycerol--glycerol-3-phosphate 3-phosphatidyltransferase
VNRADARRALSTYIEAPGARLFIRLGISPNAITLIGLAGSVGAAILVSQSLLLWGGLAVIVASGLDMFDGAVARATGRVSKFGGLLDSVADRIAEAVVLAGMLAHFLSESNDAGALLALAAMATSFMVSYVRARASGLKVDCEVGVLTRVERVLLLSAGLVVGHWWSTAIPLALAIIAVLAAVTTVQRVLHVRKELAGAAHTE